MPSLAPRVSENFHTERLVSENTPSRDCLINRNSPCFGVSRAGRSEPTSSIRPSCVARNHVQRALLLFSRQSREGMFSETGGLSMGFRSAEQVPLALPTWLFGRGYLALPRADRRAPEVALLLSGVSGSVAPSRKGSSLRHGVRIQDPFFPLPRTGQLDKDPLCYR